MKVKEYLKDNSIFSGSWWGNYTFLSDHVSSLDSVFNVKYGNQELYDVYSTMDSETLNTTLEILLTEQFEKYESEIAALNQLTVTKDISENVETVDDVDNTTTKTGKVTAFDSNDFIDDNQNLDITTEDKTTNKNSSRSETVRNGLEEYAIIKESKANYLKLALHDVKTTIVTLIV